VDGHGRAASTTCQPLTSGRAGGSSVAMAASVWWTRRVLMAARPPRLQSQGRQAGCLLCSALSLSDAAGDRHMSKQSKMSPRSIINIDESPPTIFVGFHGFTGPPEGEWTDQTHGFLPVLTMADASVNEKKNTVCNTIFVFVLSLSSLFFFSFRKPN